MGNKKSYIKKNDGVKNIKKERTISHVSWYIFEIVILKKNEKERKRTKKNEKRTKKERKRTLY